MLAACKSAGAGGRRTGSDSPAVALQRGLTNSSRALAGSHRPFASTHRLQLWGHQAQHGGHAEALALTVQPQPPGSGAALLQQAQQRHLVRGAAQLRLQSVQVQRQGGVQQGGAVPYAPEALRNRRRANPPPAGRGLTTLCRLGLPLASAVVARGEGGEGWSQQGGLAQAGKTSGPKHNSRVCGSGPCAYLETHAYSTRSRSSSPRPSKGAPAGGAPCIANRGVPRIAKALERVADKWAGLALEILGVDRGGRLDSG